MPKPVPIDRDGYVVSTSKLDGDTLTVHPATFARMQEIIARHDVNPDMASAEAMRVAGLTDDEIRSRELRETTIVVDATLFTDLRK